MSWKGLYSSYRYTPTRYPQYDRLYEKKRDLDDVRAETKRIEEDIKLNAQKDKEDLDVERKENLKMKDTLNQRNKEIEDLKAKILAAKNEDNSLEDQIKNALDVLNDTIKANDDLNAKIGKAEEELREVMTNKRKLEYGIQEIKHERDVKTADLAESNNRLKILQEDLKESLTNDKNATNTLNAKKQDLAVKEKKLNDLRAHIDKLRKLIDDRNRDASAIEDKIYQEDIALRKLAADPSRPLSVDLQRKLDLAESDAKHLREDVKALEDEIDKLNKQYETVKRENDDIEEEIKIAEDKNKALYDENVRMTRELDEHDRAEDEARRRQYEHTHTHHYCHASPHSRYPTQYYPNYY